MPPTRPTRWERRLRRFRLLRRHTYSTPHVGPSVRVVKPGGRRNHRRSLSYVRNLKEFVDDRSMARHSAVLFAKLALGTGDGKATAMSSHICARVLRARVLAAWVVTVSTLPSASSSSSLLAFPEVLRIPGDLLSPA